ncbi:MAG: ShlB/FhaC/HecB family hemolysin secretion/activation protein [Cyanobacteria bacterium J06633_2]
MYSTQYWIIPLSASIIGFISLSPIAIRPSDRQANAQSIPDTTPDTLDEFPDIIDDTIPERPSDFPDSAPDEIPDAPQPGFEPLEPLPEPPELSVPEVSFRIDTIIVNGSTVSELDDEIERIVQAYEGRELTFNELLNVRSEITQLYVENGYVTSGAFLPSNQILTDGTVEIQVVEGSVEEIQVSGLRHLRPSYVRDRLQLATDAPLDQRELLEALQLLQLDPFISQINAELTAGTTAGQNILLVDVNEPSPFNLAVGGDNYRPPSIGSAQGRVSVGYSNVFGVGDRFTGSYGRTDGLDIFNAGVSVPINAREGRLSFQFSSSESQIVDDDFEDLEIESETRSYGLNFRQPVARSPETEFALGVGIDLRRRQTFILDDIPFSFSLGPEDGTSNVTVLRFFQDWVNRGPRRVLAARSQFSFGIDAFNATVNDTGVDARFFSWVGQFQWVQRLSSRNLLVTRINTQLTPDSLLSLEQFSIGGVDTVRGYAQNQLVADNGVVGTIEFRLPITPNPRRLQLTPFFEVGTVWNTNTPDPETSTIAGIGLGLRAEIIPNLFARLDYGIPLIDVDRDADSLQEDGFYFSLSFQPF